MSLLGAWPRLARASPMASLAAKHGPGGWAVAAMVMSLEGVVEIGTGFGLSGPSDSTGRSVRVDGRGAGLRAFLLDYVQLVWLTPSMDGLFTEARVRAAPLPRPADARRRPDHAGPATALRHAPCASGNRLFQMRDESPSLLRWPRGTDGRGWRRHRRGKARCREEALRADRGDRMQSADLVPSPAPC